MLTTKGGKKERYSVYTNKIYSSKTRLFSCFVLFPFKLFCVALYFQSFFTTVNNIVFISMNDMMYCVDFAQIHQMELILLWGLFYIASTQTIFMFYEKKIYFEKKTILLCMGMRIHQGCHQQQKSSASLFKNCFIIGKSFIVAN